MTETILKLNNPTNQCSLKFKEGDAKTGEFEGYASVFNSDDQVNDTILPGAFKESLDSGRSIKMFFNHDHLDVPIGTWLSLEEDDKGLKAEGSVNMDHRLGPSVYSAMKRGDMSGLSIGFNAKSQDFDEKEDHGRIYKNLNLKEISLCTFPCEDKATVTGVKFDNLNTIRDLDRFIRDELGASNSVATKFLSHAKRILSGELDNAQERIRELESELTGRKAIDSLMKAIKSVKV